MLRHRPLRALRLLSPLLAISATPSRPRPSRLWWAFLRVMPITADVSALAAPLRLVTRFIAQPLPPLDKGAFLRYYFNMC
jgi:hypothetical protein